MSCMKARCGRRGRRSGRHAGCAPFWGGGEAEWSGGGGFVDEVGVEELGEVDFEVGIVGVI